MWSVIRHWRGLTKQPGIHKEIRRLFLSDSFSCEDAWGKRLKSPILQKVSVEELFYELDNKFASTKTVSAVDIDIFVNAVNDSDHIDEMEDLVHRLRMSSEATNICDSTHHAFIRNYLFFGDHNELIRVLNDRLNYGIFPDNYCSVLMMNHFIRTGDIANSAKVATLQMLQEDFSNELIRYLSLYSCHKYLLNPTEWEKEVDAERNNDDDEEVKVRVKYLRNPFFDNHFDLTDPNKLIGKTLTMISDIINDSYGRSYKLLGLILSGDYKEAENHLLHSINNGDQFYKTVIDLCVDTLKKAALSEEKENVVPDSLSNLTKGLDLLKEKSLCIEGNLLNILEERVKNIVSSTEKSLIEKQIQTYEDWENKRESLLRNELDELNKLEKLREIEEKKKDLLRREEELFFFEKENELELAIDNKRVRYPQKWQGKKKKKRVVDKEYIPPEVEKPHYKSL